MVPHSGRAEAVAHGVDDGLLLVIRLAHVECRLYMHRRDTSGITRVSKRGGWPCVWLIFCWRVGVRRSVCCRVRAVCASNNRLTEAFDTTSQQRARGHPQRRRDTHAAPPEAHVQHRASSSALLNSPKPAASRHTCRAAVLIETPSHSSDSCHPSFLLITPRPAFLAPVLRHHSHESSSSSVPLPRCCTPARARGKPRRSVKSLYLSLTSPFFRFHDSFLERPPPASWQGCGSVGRGRGRGGRGREGRPRRGGL